jgi:hypothetical protein
VNQNACVNGQDGRDNERSNKLAEKIKAPEDIYTWFWMFYGFEEMSGKSRNTNNTNKRKD